MAHAEKGKARFVANNGQDLGKCENRFRPCRTIAFAASHAHKGDRILVAKGSYSSGLAMLISELVPVYGGYDQLDNFQQQNPTQNSTFLTGVPKEYAEQLSNKGFNVIRDNKQSISAQLKKSVDSLTQVKKVQAEQACVNGMAGSFPCNKISMKGHLPLSSFTGNHASANDIWGHIDLNSGKEYAILGLQRGTAVIDISNPDSPAVIGVIPGQASGWRDIKVYQFYQQNSRSWRAYAYVTTENVNNEGVAIIDLNQLDENSVTLVQKQAINNSAHNVYISGVDYGLNIAAPDQTPLVHIAGADVNGGALRSYNLQNPENLTSEFDAAGKGRSDYTHDTTSLMVSDTRSSQCPNATAAGCQVIVDFNEQEIHFWDQTDAGARNKLSTVTYNQADYVHSGWWSEDKHYIFVHDEGDEQRFNINTTVNIFDISDLTSPRFVTAWRGPTAAIDHNGFVRGNRYYMSNYTRGLTILDISDPESPTEAGFFDTFTVSDNNSFNGAWGVYPYLPSGLLLVSDIRGGLFVLEDHTNDSSYNTVGFAARTFESEEGSMANIEVARNGDTSEALTVSYQTLPGSASSDDFISAEGTLFWAAGSAEAQTVNIEISPDQDETESTEQFFVRLFNPKDGTTLARNNLATVNIAGLANSGMLAFNSSEISVRENQQSIRISVDRNGGADGEVNINYLLVSQTGVVAEDIESAAGTLTWQANDRAAKSIELIPINDQLQEPEETVILRLSAVGDAQLGSQNELVIRLRDDESNTAPVANAGEDRQFNARQSASLTGSAQDQEGGELTYQWTQVSGTNAPLSRANEATVSFTAPPLAGELEFSLTVTDEFGSAHSDNVIVTVVAAAQPSTPVSPAPSSGSGGSIHWLMLMLTLCCFLTRRIHVK